MLTAGDIMSSPAIYVMADTPVREIADVLLARRISAVPVISNSGELVGIVSEADLIAHTVPPGERRSWWLDTIEKRSVRSGDLQRYIDDHGLRARDVMTREIVAVDAGTTIATIGELLEHKKIKRVPVLEHGRVVGAAPTRVMHDHLRMKLVPRARNTAMEQHQNSRITEATNEELAKRASELREDLRRHPTAAFMRRELDWIEGEIQARNRPNVRSRS